MLCVSQELPYRHVVSICTRGEALQRIVASFTLARLSLVAAYVILAAWPPKLANPESAAFTVAAPKDLHVVNRARSAD